MAKKRRTKTMPEGAPKPPLVDPQEGAQYWCDQCKAAKEVEAGACITCGNRIFANYDPIEE